MMNDPVIYAESEHPFWPDLFRQYVGTTIIIVGVDNRFVRMGTVNSSFYVNASDECWTLSKTWRCKIAGEERDRGDVIDHIMKEYPDHFEWLLFHPELMP